jgi:uracil-DNA glycosylase
VQLSEQAEKCSRCPGMIDRQAVLSRLNGPLNARVMFIGEAPGRQGADRTRIPLTGDKSGINFDSFLSSIKLSRDDIFITNAVLCNPRSCRGANRKPNRSELVNCSNFLHRQITILEPEVIATLGSVALESLRMIEPHDITLKDAGKVFGWYGRLLVPLYHPSPQVLASHRRHEEQLRDYKGLVSALRRAARNQKQSYGKRNNR